MGRIPDTPVSAWKEKIDWFMNSPQEMGTSTRRLVAAEKDQELLNFHENLKSTRKLVASET